MESDTASCVVEVPGPTATVPGPGAAAAVPEPPAEVPVPTAEVSQPDPAASGSAGTKMESDSGEGLTDGLRRR